MDYNDFSIDEQVEICKEFKESYYPDKSLFMIGISFATINPVVEKENGKFKIWEVYRTRFEKLLSSEPNVQVIDTTEADQGGITKEGLNEELTGEIIDMNGFTQSNCNHIKIEVLGQENYIINNIRLHDEIVFRKKESSQSQTEQKLTEEIKVWHINHPARKVFDNICWAKFGQTFDTLCDNDGNQQSGFWLSLILPAMIQYAAIQSEAGQKLFTLEQALEIHTNGIVSGNKQASGKDYQSQAQYFSEKFGLTIN